MAYSYWDRSYRVILDQLADLVGLYILNTFSRTIDPMQIGLYHDDSILYSPDGPKCCRIQKIERKDYKSFWIFRIRTEISYNINIVNFLNVTLNLWGNSYWYIP